MTLRAATIAPLLLGPILLSGCDEFPGSCVRDVGLLSWRQDGVYERMPPDGTQGGFEITTMRSDEVPPRESKRAVHEEHKRSWALHLSRADDFVQFELTHHGVIPDPEAAKRLNESFQLLDLGLPHPEGWGFSWGGGVC